MYRGPFVAPTTWSQRKILQTPTPVLTIVEQNLGLREVGQVLYLCKSESVLSALKNFPRWKKKKVVVVVGLLSISGFCLLKRQKN
jgi:hypothetical protein